MRAQAGVLKRAVIEEQNKNAALREAFRVKETNLRRVEQEVDSLGFRNKQLEHRVASLQDDLTTTNTGNSKKGGKLLKSSSQTTANAPSSSQHVADLVVTEELQKKIVECAQLSSTVADTAIETQLQYNRIAELEALIHRMNAEHSEAEAKLRAEIAQLSSANHEMETKLTEASSIVSSDDTIFVTDCEPVTKVPPTNGNLSSESSGSCRLEERVAALEKEVIDWRTQCETLRIAAKISTVNVTDVPASDVDNVKAQTQSVDQLAHELTPNERMLVEHFQKKCEKLLTDKYLAESKLVLFMEEVGLASFSLAFLWKGGELNNLQLKFTLIIFNNFLFQSESLQKHLDIVDNDLKMQERKFRESQRNLQMVDEDLVSFSSFLVAVRSLLVGFLLAFFHLLSKIPISMWLGTFLISR